MLKGMHAITSRIGIRRAHIAAQFAVVVSYIMLHFVRDSKTVLITLHGVMSSALAMQSGTCVAFLNNAAQPHELTFLTGIAVLMEAIGKGLGPMITAVFFAWCLESFGWWG